MSENLTTVFLFREYAKLPNVVVDPRLTRLVEQVSEAVCGVLDRTFTATTYREWQDGSGQRYLRARQYPITALYGCSVFLSDVLSITHPTATLASVICKTDRITTNLVTSGVEAEVDYAFATYPTLTSLNTALLAAGWTTTLATDAGAKQTKLIRPDSGMAHGGEYFDISIADEWETCRVAEGTDDLIERIPQTAFPAGRSNICLWYKAGYTIPADNASSSALATAGNLPAGLTMLVNQILKTVYDAATQATGGMQSENFGDYSYSLGQSGRSVLTQAITEALPQLSDYRRISLEP